MPPAAGDLGSFFAVMPFLNSFFVLDSPFFLGAVLHHLQHWLRVLFSLGGGVLGFVGARWVLKNHFDDLWKFRKNLPKIQGVLEIRQVMSRDEGYFSKDEKRTIFWDYFPPKNPVNSTIVFLCGGLGAKVVSRFQPTFITGPSPSLVVKVPANLLATLGTCYWTFRENGTKKEAQYHRVHHPKSGILQ